MAFHEKSQVNIELQNNQERASEYNLVPHMKF
jgi:hypothetical protein